MALQSYVQSMGGGFGAVRARALPAAPHASHAPHTPLRHAHVTSTTHPHHLHGELPRLRASAPPAAAHPRCVTGMNEMNLRGLLSPAANRALAVAHTRPPHLAAQHAPHAAAMHAYQQSECRAGSRPPRPHISRPLCPQ